MGIGRTAKIILAIFILFSIGCAYAQPTNKAHQFDVKAAYTQFNSLNTTLAATATDLAALKIGTVKLERLRDRAKLCVESSEAQLKMLNTLLESIQILRAQRANVEQKYLVTKKDIYARQVADCRLLAFRAQESIANFKDTIQELSARTLLRRTIPIWDINKIDFRGAAEAVAVEKITNISGITDLSAVQWLILLGISILFTILASWFRSRCKIWIHKLPKEHNFIISVLTTVRSYLIPLVILGVLAGFFAVVFLGIVPSPSIELISYYVLLYTGIMAIVSLLFSPPRPASSILHHSPKLGRSFVWRSAALVGLATIGVIVVTVFRGQVFEDIFIGIIQSVFYTLLSLIVIWFCWLFTNLPLMKNSHKALAVLIRVILLAFLVAIASTQMLGYHHFALHLISSIFLTFVAIGVFWLIVKLMEGVGDFLNSERFYLSRIIRGQLGLKHGKKLTEFTFIKFAVYILGLFFFVLFILRAWGISLNVIDQIQAAFMDGFSISNLKIVPSQIIAGLLTLGILLVISRWVSSSIARHHEFSGEKQTQVAMASIIGYIGFGLALIIALLIAGVNFTGLAVIAGALSVGIGLGLQSIVNNFVSGIILLLEKPIKTGDRVIVNGVEGFVKKVRIRSTQIETIKREDIIVPNSDLITHQVTNFMFGDNFGRVVCKVGVAYGSDVELVRETLLAITKGVPEIVQEEPNMPSVLFGEFGESSLNFSLYCTIADVNMRYRVMSDLHFAIDKAFREKNIVIAFPQLDIHMKHD